MWLKLAKIGKNWPIFKLFFFFSYFHVFQVVEHIWDIFSTITFKKLDFSKKIEKFYFWSIFANFSHTL
jgi:hypothetical protein